MGIVKICLLVFANHSLSVFLWERVFTLFQANLYFTYQKATDAPFDTAMGVFHTAVKQVTNTTCRLLLRCQQYYSNSAHRRICVQGLHPE